MPLKNPVIDDVQKDKVSSLPLRRSKRLNTNPSTLPKVLTKHASETSKTKENGNFSVAEELFQVEEIKSSATNEVTEDLDTGITKSQDRTLTSICVQDSLLNDGTKLTVKQNSTNGSNEISDEFATKRITRSQGNARAKIETKECCVVLEVTNALQAISFEQKSDASNFDKASEVDSGKQGDGQISSKEEFEEFSSSKTSQEEEQITLNKTIEEVLPISCNLNLNIKPVVNMPDGKDAMDPKAEDEFLDNSVAMKNDIKMKAPETTVNKNGVFENNEQKQEHEVTVNNNEEIQSQIVGKLEFSKSPSPTDCSDEVFNITSETEARSLNELSDDVNGVNNRKSISGNEVPDNADSSLDSSLEKITVHQASIEENDIDSKIDHLLSSRFSTSADDEDDDDDDDDENEHNSFIDSMAEEGEEDTPSEGSNDIVEVGEEINTTDSEFSPDESYENNSFIDDKEDYQLLSGEEYDLSFDKTIKKSRIIKLSSGSDDDIVRISKPMKKPQKVRKKSRIIKFSDSSDDEDDRCNVNGNVENKENEKNPNLCNDEPSQVTVIEKQTSDSSDDEDDRCNVNGNAENEENEKNSNLCNDEPSQVTVIEKQTEVEKNLEITDISNNEDNKENANRPNVLNNLEVEVTSCNNESTTMDVNQLLENEYEKTNKIVDVSDFQQSNSINYKKNEETFATIELNKCNDVNDLSTSLASVNVNVNMRTESNSVTNYFNLKNIDRKRLSDRINEVIDSCSNITNIREMSLILSVDYSNSTQGFKNEVDASIQTKVVEDAIHKPKLSQDCSKKRRRRKRKIRNKKMLPENIREDEESIKPKTKKIKLDENKRNEKPFIIHQKENMSAPSTKLDKQLQEQNNVAEEAIHNTKLSQDCSKKRSGRNRKIRNKKILPENIREHEESIKPKTKKIKLDENKRNEKPFIYHKENMSASSTKLDKQLQEQNNYISKQKNVNNKRSTVVETGNEELSKEIRVPMPENINVKRKRRLKENKRTDRNLAMTILDEALFDVKNKKPSSINQDVQICEWDVNSLKVKPSSPSGLEKNKMKHDSINENENLNVQNKFTAKDFKNLMLYDSSRIKRISTKKALTKRGLNA